MKDSTKHLILRWLHLTLSIPILGYIYSPFEEIPNYAPLVRYVFLPLLVLLGLWMWKGHLVRRWIFKYALGSPPSAHGSSTEQELRSRRHSS